MTMKKIKPGATYSIPVDTTKARTLTAEAISIVNYTLIIGGNKTLEKTQLALKNHHSIPVGETASIVNNAPLNQGGIADLKIFY